MNLMKQLLSPEEKKKLTKKSNFKKEKTWKRIWLNKEKLKEKNLKLF